MALKAEQIARYSLHEPKHFAVQLSQTKHRLKICEHFKIEEGWKVLEIGCGQGDTTAVLASMVGADGHIDAVDPGRPDYGSPYTLKQAQDHLLDSEIGSRIDFHFIDPIAFLKKTKTKYDAIIMVHCIWYFSNPGILPSIIDACTSKTNRICIAEYAASGSLPAQQPHILAAYTQAAAQANLVTSESNIQVIYTPAQIVQVMSKFTLVHGLTITPDEDLDDGRWEVGIVCSPTFVQGSSKTSFLIQSMQSSVKAQVAALRPAKVRTMDVAISIWQ